MITQEDFKSRFTVHGKSSFTLPKLHPISSLQLPQKALLHYLDFDGIGLGPRASDGLLSKVKGTVFVDNILDFSKTSEILGSPIHVSGVSPSGLIVQYRQQNRSIRLLNNLTRLEGSPNDLVVENYALLAHLYKYSGNKYSDYYTWRNIYAQMAVRSKTLVDLTTRQQFIEIELPEQLPSLTVLQSYHNDTNIEPLKHLLRPEDKILADLFQWAGVDRNRSVIKDLASTNIDIIFRRFNAWICVNLAWLDSFRRSDENPKGSYAPRDFAIRLLHFIYSFHAQAIKVDDLNLNAEDVDADATVVLPSVNDEDDLDAPTVPEDTSVIEEELLSVKQDVVAEIADNEEEETSAIIVKPKLTEILLNPLPVTSTSTHVSPIGKKALDLAKKGVISPGELKRIERISEVYKTLPSPYNPGKLLVEDAKITEEDVVIRPDVLTTDKVVSDPSMQTSRVDVFDRQYIDKVLRKDIVNSVLSMQNAAVAITNYKIDPIDTIVNEAEEHSIQMTTATGETSTLKFVIPRLRSDGTFKYNRTVYRMRKQRTDLVLRKINQRTVALNTYYAKVFISRSERKRFDFTDWFQSRLLVKCFDPTDNDITNGLVSTVEGYDKPYPLYYTTIGSTLISFTASGITFNFDPVNRKEVLRLSDADIAREGKDLAHIGRKDGKLISIDDEGTILVDYNTTSDTINGLLKIDIDNAPIDIAEVKVYSKQIPAGIALGYLYGLEELLTRFSIKHRKVSLGERLLLQPGEYAVRFKNQSLVFSRYDKVASLIMNGFNHLHAYIKNYDIGLFDNKEVYQAIMDKAGIGRRYVTKLDDMEALMIDPIAKDILTMMGEPTEFKALIMRSIEMIATDYVPRRIYSADGKIEVTERVKGYERFAGVVYESLSKAISSYMARSAVSNAKIVLNPNEIVQNIISDPTCSPVNNINPIHSLREREVVTFNGRGGRNKRAMTAKTRLFTDEDMGWISEGSVDSGDIGVITYMPQNANITTVRGTIRAFDFDRDGPGAVMSSASMAAPFADGDDQVKLH